MTRAAAGGNTWGSAARRAVTLGDLGSSPQQVLPPKYGVLMEVTFLHGFYNRERFQCSDFQCAPTRATAEVLHSLGLILLIEDTRFAVLYDVRNKEGLEDFLRRHASAEGSPPELSFWTRLSFVLTVRNMQFANVTNMPLNMNPLTRNFYLSNRDAHEEEKVVYLTPAPDREVSAREIFDVKPAEFALTIPCGMEVVVYDVSGEEVETVPTHCEGEKHGNVPISLADRVYVNLATKPEGLYHYEIAWKPSSPPVSPPELAPHVWHDLVEEALAKSPPPPGIDRLREAVHEVERPLRERTFVYTSASPVPLVFIDLFFSNPDGEPTGVYPTSGLGEGEDFKVAPVRYVLLFGARSTYWHYYIVPPEHVKFTDLAIECLSSPAIEFDGPHKVILPNARRAYSFISTEPVRLQQRSEVRLRLVGRREHDAGRGTLLEPLPLASPSSVRPDRRKPERDALSEIYVYV